MEVDQPESATLLAIQGHLSDPNLDPEMRSKLKAAETLVKRYNSYAAGDKMEVGKLVKWKSGMSNRRMPQNDDVGIVTRVMETPLNDPLKKDAGNPYFREPLDVAVAILDTDGEFIEFHYDSHRLRVVDEADCAPRLVSKLRELLKRLHTPTVFHVGDAVRWKEGLKNKKRPKEDEPAVIVEVLPEMIFDKTKDAGGQYFREPLEVKVGMLDSDGEFVIYHFDPRRLEKLSPEEEERLLHSGGARQRRASFSGSEGGGSEEEFQDGEGDVD